MLVSDTLMILIIIWNALISISFIFMCFLLFRQNKFPSSKIASDVKESAQENVTDLPPFNENNRPISAIKTSGVYAHPLDLETECRNLQTSGSFDYQKVVHDESEDDIECLDQQTPFSAKVAERSSTRMDDHSSKNTEEKAVRKRGEHKRKTRMQLPRRGLNDTGVSVIRCTMNDTAVSTRHVDLANKTQVSFMDDVLDITPQDKAPHRSSLVTTFKLPPEHLNRNSNY